MRKLQRSSQTENFARHAALERTINYVARRSFVRNFSDPPRNIGIRHWNSFMMFQRDVSYLCWWNLSTGRKLDRALTESTTYLRCIGNESVQIRRYAGIIDNRQVISVVYCLCHRDPSGTDCTCRFLAAIAFDGNKTTKRTK